jgi:hypothetical protein
MESYGRQSGLYERFLCIWQTFNTYQTVQVVKHAQGYPGVARAVGQVDSRRTGRY